MSLIPHIPNFPGIPPGLQKLESTIAQFSSLPSTAKAAMAQKAAASTAVLAGSANASSSTSIMLQLQSTNTPATLTQVIVPRSPGSPGRAPQLASIPSSASPIASITFDISSAQDGYAQNVSYSFAARQSIHQTAGGFYVDEFGTAPGTFALDVMVIAEGDLPARLANFKALLDKAKLDSPLSPAYPTVLRYINAYDGCSYVLTQTQLDLRYASDRPNTLLVTITGSILQDYSTQPVRGRAANVVAATTKDAPAVLASQESILNYTA